MRFIAKRVLRGRWGRSSPHWVELKSAGGEQTNWTSSLSLLLEFRRNSYCFKSCLLAPHHWLGIDESGGIFKLFMTVGARLENQANRACLPHRKAKKLIETPLTGFTLAMGGLPSWKLSTYCKVITLQGLLFLGAIPH